MMGTDSSADLHIKVHPRQADTAIHPTGSPSAGRRARPSQLHSSPSSRLFTEFEPFKKWCPWLVPSFVVANIALFLVAMYINNCPKNSASCVARFLGRFSFQPLKENPLLGPSSSTLEKMGALDVSEVINRRQAWRLVTCIWLHAGVFHVLANMLSLLFIGIRLEQEFGFVRIGLLYVISGFGGSLLSALFIQSTISVGASGALFGLLGSMLSELITNWTIYSNKFAALLTLVFIIAINLALGILPHVDNFAHIGGFLSGFLLGFVFFMRPQFGWVSQRNAPPGYVPTSTKPKHKMYQYVLLVISLILLIVGFTIGLIMLLQGVNANDHCSWCHYLSCVPTSLWNCQPHNLYCQTSQTVNQLNLTCLSNGKSSSYMMANNGSSQIQQLCAQLCSS
ncbi:RHOMBOID-like protein 1 [Malania oleifera]|uniref:RHOMBOID-like protein 1 n=1 Tax=Malania oleifera TaxID=397392 RepID=UPI0025ADC8AC|nr:RHOMBOID-like protein 1 [Malania oleifera]